MLNARRSLCSAERGGIVTRGLGRTGLSAAAAALLASAAATTARAQDYYPSKPVVIVVPAAAGGPTDTLARNLGVAMGSALKQQMIIDNSGGAGGTIGINKAAKARPDGYTVLLYHIGMSTSPALYRKLAYDTVNDFEYIGQVADVPMTLVAKKGMSPRTFGELLAYAKATQGTLTYANAGIGSASYLCGVLFMSTIQADFTTVPYKGTGPAMTDLVGGRVDLMCDQTTNTTPQIKAGTIKVYGVTSNVRVPSLPDVPTLDEQGLKGFALVVWNGLFAPKGTPKPAPDRLVGALQTAVMDPAFKTRLADLGAEPVAVGKATPESLRTLLKSELDKWGPIIRKTGVYAD
jgi:tripartite-type tricarboxylate transporter receptor subunit TctC